MSYVVFELDLYYANYVIPSYVGYVVRRTNIKNKTIKNRTSELTSMHAYTQFELIVRSMFNGETVDG